MSTRLAATGAIVVTLAGLAVGAFIAFRSGGDDRFSECRMSAIAGGAGAIGGPFNLTDHTGKRVSETDVISGPTLIYFGYTTCPDVCPLDNARNAAAVDLLAERGMNVTPVLISVDPGRDTPEIMAEYVEYMHPKMIGLTGSDEDIATAAKAYRAYYAQNGSGEDYLMDHSTFTYLMVPEDGFLEFFKRDLAPEEMADMVGCFVERI